MSRNKFILLFAILVIIYLVMPSEGIYGSIKANVILALPFLMIGVIIYLFTTVIVMRRAWRKLDNNVIDDNVIAFAKIMNISFDVKRMMGVNNLLDLYTKVNFSRHEGEGAAVSGYETQETGCTASGTGCFRRQCAGKT